MANRLEIKRSQSPRGDRPNMSDLRIVLLGKNASENNRVGNLILDKKVFRKKTPQPDVEEHSERVEGRNITIINTIHLLKSKISQQKIAQKVSEFSSPEPDVIILVLQHNDFSERKRDRLLSVLNCFGEQAMKRTMILTTDDETHSAEKKHENEFIQQISTECGGGRLQLQNTQRSQILQKVDEILIRSGFKETQQSSSLNQVDKPSVFSMSKNQKLILAICGYNEEIKASMSKLLLGKNTAISAQESTSVRVWSDVEVHGRLISLVELPALNRLSEEEVKRQTLHCVSLCDPGVHVFLLIVPATPLTNEEREGIEKIQRIFSSGKHFILIFFTYLHIVEKATDFVKSSPESQRLISCCGGQYRVIGLKEPESSRQIPELLDYIENMKTEPYSLQMYVKAQENRVRNESKQKLQSEVGRSCPDFSRPISCDLRIVLLGKNVSENSRVGNLILGEDTFESEASSAERKLQQHRQGVGRHLEDRYVTVIISPQLLQTHLSLRHITQTVRECVNLSDPGPHAFILVLQYNDFTEEDMIRVKMILKEFSEEAIKHTIVITTDQESYRSYVYLGNRAIYHLIKDCGGAHLQLDERRPEWRSEVFEMVDKKLKENQEDCLTCDVFHDVRGTPMNEEQNISEEENDHRESDESDEVSANVSEKQKLNLVLCGSDATLKDSVSKLFRGKNMKPLHEGDIRSECVKKEKIHGRQISLVELPALSRLSEEEVMRQTLCCVSLCDPGVHAFLLIVPVGPLTDGDTTEIEKIQKNFYSRKHLIVIFINDGTVDRPVTDFIKQSPEFQKLISLCGGQYCVMGLKEPENSRQIPELLDYIENTKIKPYSAQMYVKAQENRVRCETEEKYKEELKRMETEIKELKQKIHSEDAECSDDQRSLRIVLIGKTGNGKSATGNTILGREEFVSQLNPDSVTTDCQKAVGEVDDRPVAVVDTPGLFDTTLSNEQVVEEIVKCVSLSSPGPHVFVIVLSLGRITKEETDTMDLIKKIFGPKSAQFSIVLFTRGDDLGNASIQQYVEKCKSAELKKLIRDCGNRFLSFNNKGREKTQVIQLINMIEEVKNTNEGRYFTNSMFEEAEMSIKKRMEEILKEREREIQTQHEALKAKYEMEKENMMKRLEEEKQRADEERKKMENQLREKEEKLRKEFEEKEKAEQKKQEIEKQKRSEEEKRKKNEYHQKIEEMKREIENQRLQYEKQQRERKEKDSKREEKYRQDQEKMKKEQERMIAELQMKQQEEIKKRESEEKMRNEEEEKERQRWKIKIKEAENDKKEIQEEIKQQQREWEDEKKQKMREREEEERKRKEKHEEQLREKQEELEEIRKRFEREREEERQKVEEERQKQRREREEKERKYEEKKTETKRYYERLEQERKEEWERRKQEDDERRKEERKRWKEMIEDLKQEQEEEIKRREKQEKDRKEKEEKERDEMKQKHEEEINVMKKKHEDEARKLAEETIELEESKEELQQMLEKHQKQHEILEKLYQLLQLKKGLEKKAEDYHKRLQDEKGDELHKLQEEVDKFLEENKKESSFCSIQ